VKEGVEVQGRAVLGGDSDDVHDRNTRRRCYLEKWEERLPQEALSISLSVQGHPVLAVGPHLQPPTRRGAADAER
jgi:hypothetical protein